MKIFCIPRLPRAMPYWDGATYGTIFRCLMGGQIIDGPDLGKLRLSLSEILGVSNVTLCGSGSLSLEFALRASGVGERDEVVIPAFCCSAVALPILAVGAT